MTDARNFITLTATVALLLVAGTSCASDEDAVESPTTSSASSSSPTSAAPTASAEAAALAAEAAAKNYFADIDALRQDPSRPLGDLRQAAASVELLAQETLLRSERGRGHRQVGDTRIVEIVVQSVNLENSDPKAGRAPIAEVDVCWDVSRVDIVDRSGESVVVPARPEAGWVRLSIVNYRWPARPAAGWRVASSQDLRQAPCVAS